MRFAPFVTVSGGQASFTMLSAWCGEEKPQGEGCRRKQTWPDTVYTLDGLTHRSTGQRGMAHPDLRAEEDSSGGSEEGQKDKGIRQGRVAQQVWSSWKEGLKGKQGSPKT